MHFLQSHFAITDVAQHMHCTREGAMCRRPWWQPWPGDKFVKFLYQIVDLGANVQYFKACHILSFPIMCMTLSMKHDFTECEQKGTRVSHFMERLSICLVFDSSHRIRHMNVHSGRIWMCTELVGVFPRSGHYLLCSHCLNTMLLTIVCMSWAAECAAASKVEYGCLCTSRRICTWRENICYSAGWKICWMWALCMWWTECRCRSISQSTRLSFIEMYHIAKANPYTAEGQHTTVVYIRQYIWLLPPYSVLAISRLSTSSTSQVQDPPVECSLQWDGQRSWITNRS